MSVIMRTARIVSTSLKCRVIFIAAPHCGFQRFFASRSFPPHTVIDMPALSPTMAEGNVGAWRKNIGDKLTPGDVLVEIETDKATMDYEFQDDGYLAQILVQEGAKNVPVGRPIGVFVDDESDVVAFKDFTMNDATTKTVPSQSMEEAGADSPKAPFGDPSHSDKTLSPSRLADSAESQKSTDIRTSTSSAFVGRILASPLAKQIALQKGIRLVDIKGSGPNGRIIKRDVENYEPAKTESSAVSSSSSSGSQPSVSHAQFVDTPISSMRRVIAKRLSESKLTAPNYMVSCTASVSKLLQLRKNLNDSADGAYKLSVNDILIKAMALASLKVPAVNSQWLEDKDVIRQYCIVDVSVAVSTENGLVTPVIRNANQLGLSEISKRAKDLANRARSKKLTPEEYEGGTITISNMGMNHAVTSFNAIINPPQVAILAVGTVERRAVEDPEAEFGFTFDDTMTFTGTFDHRVVDGATGAEWIREFKKLVENPLLLLL